MHTETNTLLDSRNMLPQPHHQQHYMSHLSPDHLVPEQTNPQSFSHMPSTRDTAITSLNEGLYAPTNQHMTSACPSHYYNRGLDSGGGLEEPRFGCSNTLSSSSSSSSSSSNDSSYSCPNSVANTNRNSTSIGVNLRVTGQCSQGGRKYMEDYFSVAYQQSENAKDLEYAFIGIYDGHGGAEAAKFAKEHLMMEIINQRLFWSDNDHDVLRAIREGYIATHYAMWREQDKWPKTANGLPSTAGTTATVAFIRREKIYIGHVGDSGIVLGYQNENENFWRAKQLTTDHKPESMEERTRIMNSGGKVVVKSGVPRVVWNRPRNASHRGPIRKKTLVDEIPFLAVARSLGDLWSYNSERNEFVVSPDPDVKVIPINPNTFRCLIFGTDGLWNVVNAQEAVNTVRDKEVINERLLAQRGESPHEGNQWTNPSKSLVDQAIRTWSNKKMRADNTSVVTVILYPPGQTDHTMETGCKAGNGALTNPPAFVQPISYGLEYTQVQAEVPEYDDATTYKEMALKYLPPEAYRNFNYYADDSDTEGEDNEDESEEEETPPGDLQQNTNYQQNLNSSNNCNWHTGIPNIPALNTHPVKAHRLIEANEEDEDDEEEEEVEEEDEDMEEEESEERHVERPLCIINYQNYVHLESEETNNATDSYINTFAESYNTILTASQDECVTAPSSSSSSSSSSSNSNSNSNCQSVTPPNMHDILQEQQLYQQQCMSEEEGYSLTKLETRREQQSCKSLENRTTECTTNVQTFKIFHETPGHQIPSQEPSQIEVYHENAERYYHNQPPQFMQQKPLELHSLLQQEREEEQQVAYERLQMESKRQQEQQQNIAAYACLQGVNSCVTNTLLAQPTEEVVEYLEDDSALVEEEIISTDVGHIAMELEKDETVQINEISSSSSGEDSRHEASSNEPIIETIENVIEIVTEEHQQIEIEKTSNSICPPPSLTIPSKPTPSALALTTPLKTSLHHSKRTKSSYLYANVPNENTLQRISNSKNQHSNLFSNAQQVIENRRKSLCMTPSINMTPPDATSTPMMQRQLRSTATPCSSTNTSLKDYGKRTLRTRNSLAKDMKAKSSLVATALKYPHNAATRNFLRTTAANLMVSKPLLLNEQHLTPCNRRTMSTSSNGRTPNRSNIQTRREKLNGSLNQNKAKMTNTGHLQLNLRSRQLQPTTASSNSSTSSNISPLRSSPAAATTPVIKRASLSERRILRSMHTRSSSSKSSQNPANFSKSTRTQSTGSNLAAPPPSPKLINAAAAVAAATRARSLLNAKHTAAANGTQSVVSSVFGKRSSLRSNGSSPHPAVLSNTAAIASPAPTRHTLRGRIVKNMKR